MNEQLYEMIDMTRPRPALYLGVAGITPLRNFLDGYQSALTHHLPEEKITVLPPLPFWFFHEYVMLQCGYGESTSGWKNMILNWSGGNEEEALIEFYRHYDGFRALRLESCRSVVLDEHNRYYHEHGSGVTRTVGDGAPGPCYPSAKKVSILKLTNGIGYLVLVEMRQAIELEYHIYRKKSDAMEHVEWYFGKVERWVQTEIEILRLEKPCLP